MENDNVPGFVTATVASWSCTFSLLVDASYVMSVAKVATSAPDVSAFAKLDIALVEVTEDPETDLVTATVVCKLSGWPCVVVSSNGVVLLPSFCVIVIEKSLVFSAVSLVKITTLWPTPPCVSSASVPVLNLDWNVLLPFRADCILSLAADAVSPSAKVPLTVILLSAFAIEKVAGFFCATPCNVHDSFVLFAVINAVLAPAFNVPVAKLPPAIIPKPFNENGHYSASDNKFFPFLVPVGSKNLESFDSLEKTSIDFYATVRSLYLQDRTKKIKNKSSSDDDTWGELDK